MSQVYQFVDFILFYLLKKKKSRGDVAEMVAELTLQCRIYFISHITVLAMVYNMNIAGKQ